MNTENNYEEFFLSKFITVFTDIVNFVINNINDEKTYEDFLKVKTYIDDKRLNFNKIIEKVGLNKKLQEEITKFYNSNYDLKIFSKKEKSFWVIVPPLNLGDIYRKLTNENIVKFYELNKFLFVSALGYVKVKDFDFVPKIDDNNVNNNYDVTELYSGNEIKRDVNTFDFILNNLLQNLTGDKNENIDALNDKIGDFFKSGDQSQIINSTNIIEQNLNENKEASKASVDLIKNMLGGVKQELIDLGKNNTGEKDLNVLVGIGKKLSKNMAGTFNKDEIDPFELIDTTIQMANGVSGTKNFDVIGKVIKNQMIDMMNEQNKKKALGKK